MSSSDPTQTAGGPDTVVGHVAVAPRQADGPFEIGSRVADRYVIVRFLGRGGMGEVYEAEDEELGRRVALKVLLRARFGEERATALLRSEIANARRVTHPNVCRVFDLTTHRDASGRVVRLYSMELLEGETLADRIARRGRMSEDEALPIVRQLCAGLAAAHAAGIVHRDFKPHNVMLCGERAVIVDFGLAIALESDANGTSAEVMGTPAYMAPEQLGGDTVTRAVDIYALGVTLHDLVGESRWDPIVERCRARAPSERPTLAEVIAAIEPPPLRRRGRPLVAIVAAAVVVAAGAGAVVVARSSDATHRPRVVEHVSDDAVAKIVRLAGPSGEKIEDAATDPAGNLYLVGHGGAGVSIGGAPLPQARGQSLAVVARIDADERLRWSRTFSSTSRMSLAAVAVVGDQIVVGGYAGKGDLDLGRGGRTTVDKAVGLVVGMSNLDGAEVWRRVLVSSEEAMVRDVDVGPDGNIYVVGDHAGATDFGDGVVRRSQGPSMFVASYDPAGALRWVLAGTKGGNARGRAVAFAGDMVVIVGSVAGAFELGGTSGTNGWARQGLIAAVDRVTGEPRWVLSLATSSEIWAVAPSADGSLWIGGALSGPLELIPGQLLEVPALKSRPLVAALDLATGQPRWARAIDGGTAVSWGIRVLLPLPDGRWFASGGFHGELAVGATRVRDTGEVDSFVVLLDGDGAVTSTAVLGGAGGERFRGAAFVGPGVVALWGRHEGIQLGRHGVASAGIGDGLYTELRLDALFR